MDKFSRLAFSNISRGLIFANAKITKKFFFIWFVDHVCATGSPTWMCVRVRARAGARVRVCVCVIRNEHISGQFYSMGKMF